MAGSSATAGSSGEGQDGNLAGMKLYDRQIERSLSLLKGLQGRRLAVPGSPWPDAGEQNLVLRGEMAYELGGGTLPAIGGFGLTSSKALVGGDEAWLYGPDLPELHADSPYARLAFLRVADEGPGDVAPGGAARGDVASGDVTRSDTGEDPGDAAHTAIRRIEHTRYRVSPRGYMMRISAASEREPVRIGREALRDGLDFAKVGSLFLAGYRSHPEVLASKLIFITLPAFPYGELRRLASQAEAITRSLDRIFGNLIMDCAKCNLKPVCDEVDGMRETHFSHMRK